MDKKVGNNNKQRMVKVEFKNGLQKVLYSHYFQNIVMNVLKKHVKTYQYL